MNNFKLTTAELTAFMVIVNDRIAYLKSKGFLVKAPNDIAIRNRAIDYAVANKELTLKAGANRGMCRIINDVVECTCRAAHHGVTEGTVIGKYGFPLNWFSDDFKAALKCQLRQNVS